ncbi:hypothetical protein SCHPADRAFT_887993 [Schizopora paradoxa]|uniref:Uncharacterized protein n=1 Tax=Schizopora paradoxa TaxID=27342 RepID=A0A0H2S2W2_9AGAM|nr:hypothetical protein SCHPADRAFT_887993 [Schizopora paradoxa]
MFAFRRDGGDAPDVTIYGSGQGGAVIMLVLAGVFSITAVVAASMYYLVFVRRTKTFHRTNLAPYLISLLLANVLQAIGTIMNARWVKDGKVFNGGFCAAQGGIKNAANVGTAIWSFTIAVHVFNLLFLRWRTTRISMFATLVGGWSFVLMIVTLGPYAIQTSDRGPYFGVSGNWCWITDNYPKEQTFMEYFFEFLSAGLGFALYALVLLRVRGNLIKVAEDDEDEKDRQVGRKQWAYGDWRIIWIPRSEAWQLSFGRDMIDSAMLRIAANMVWYPVAYSVLLVPVALARFSTFTGHHVPFWATIFTDTIFNLTGLVNASLLIYTRSVLPDTTTLPHFTTPRPRPQSKSSSIFTFVSSSADFVSEKAASLSADDDDDDLRFKPQVRGTVSADETTWKKVRTVPLGGVTPFVLPPLQAAVSAPSRATPSPSPPPPAAPSVAKRTSTALKSFLLKPADLKDSSCSRPASRVSLSSAATDGSSSSGSSSNAAKRKSLKKLTIPKPILPRLRPSPPLMMDTEYFFSGPQAAIDSRAPIKVHVRKSVESYESYDTKSTQ